MEGGRRAPHVVLAFSGVSLRLQGREMLTRSRAEEAGEMSSVTKTRAARFHVHEGLAWTVGLRETGGGAVGARGWRSGAGVERGRGACGVMNGVPCVDAGDPGCSAARRVSVPRNCTLGNRVVVVCGERFATHTKAWGMASCSVRCSATCDPGWEEAGVPLGNLSVSTWNDQSQSQ